MCDTHGGDGASWQGRGARKTGRGTAKQFPEAFYLYIKPRESLSGFALGIVIHYSYLSDLPKNQAQTLIKPSKCSSSPPGAVRTEQVLPGVQGAHR